MNNNCKYYRTRTDKRIKHGYCLKNKNKVPLFCKGCEEYQNTIEKKLKVSSKQLLKSNNHQIKNVTNCHKLKQCRQKSKKLAKVERNRFSILTNDLEHCIICGCKDVFFGTGNRVNSMKFGCVIPLCLEHHVEMHKSKE